ncbi:MAG: HAD family hydrolase [Halomonadaceae bacterium]|nr:MAG: HAD family hydrolase [Halomonadaceae bacterium]
MTLAIFDLDNTLLCGDSDHAWGDFLVTEGVVDGDAYRSANDAFLKAYQNGTLKIRDYLAFALQPLAQTPLPRLLALREQFMQERIYPLILPKGQALVADHRRQGHQLLMITATNQFVTAPIADALGFESLIATEPEFLDGAYTGRVQGTPSFQEGKIERLHQWLAATGGGEQQMQGAWFYSDSHNDLPLLEQVQNPVAVDPDDTLARAARDRGWPVISLRG